MRLALRSMLSASSSFSPPEAQAGKRCCPRGLLRMLTRMRFNGRYTSGADSQKSPSRVNPPGTERTGIHHHHNPLPWLLAVYSPSLLTAEDADWGGASWASAPVIHPPPIISSRPFQAQVTSALKYTRCTADSAVRAAILPANKRIPGQGSRCAQTGLGWLASEIINSPGKPSQRGAALTADFHDCCNRLGSLSSICVEALEYKFNPARRRLSP
jgi:hypothetical protein